MRFSRDTWRWALGLIYIVAVAIIWIAASYIVQSVVDSGVSPFLITYICNSLFVVLIPIIEISRYLEVILKGSWHWFRNRNVPDSQLSVNSEEVNLLVQTGQPTGPYVLSNNQQENISLIHSRIQDSESILSIHAIAFSGGESCLMTDDSTKQVNTEEHWTRCQVAKSNTILSSSSSLFTFLVAVAFLGEKFTWVKLVSVLLCMGGTIMVSLSDSSVGLNAIATNPLLGDILALVSAGIYAVYITLIRQKLTDEKKNCQASTAQFLGFLGLFNLLIFFPVLLVLNFTKLEPFDKLSWNQLGLIVGKG
ncbi:hypothetical protein ZIOFF_071240 [Zingiber officinale]|uniref:Solute carrier family 35 member F5 n=1 Tax=Zingiber officinale TaxID=94328 RepID=A0A8J5C172_ZINOF|nr:hypothetical protein ZIOFF_071240 [Zingiber officinale]